MMRNLGIVTLKPVGGLVTNNPNFGADQAQKLAEQQARQAAQAAQQAKVDALAQKLAEEQAKLRN